MSSVYLLLTIVYFITLLDLRNAMKGLLEQDIATESESVSNQFVLFLVSYSTRFLFMLAEILVFDKLEGNNFWW